MLSVRSVTQLTASLKEMRDSDITLSENASKMLSILRKISHDQLFDEESELLNQAIEHFNTIEGDKNPWPEITDESLASPECILQLFIDLNNKLGSKELNQAFQARAYSCGWISKHFQSLLDILKNQIPDALELYNANQYLIAPVQRLPKLPLFSKAWKSEIESENPEKLSTTQAGLLHSSKQAIAGINRKFLRLLSALNQIIKAGEYENALQQENQNSLVSKFWSLIKRNEINAKVDFTTPALNTAVEQTLSFSNTLGNISGVFILDNQNEDLETKEMDADQVFLQNSLIDDNEPLQQSEEYYTSLQEINEKLEKSIRDFNQEIVSPSIETAPSIAPLSVSVPIIATPPSIAPLPVSVPIPQVSDDAAIVENETNNPLIACLKNTNTYLSQRAQKTRGISFFGHDGSEDYYARRDSWKAILIAIKDSSRMDIAYNYTLPTLLKDSINKFGNGSSKKYANLLSSIKILLETYDRDSFDCMVKGAIDYIETSEKVHQLLDRLKYYHENRLNPPKTYKENLAMIAQDKQKYVELVEGRSEFLRLEKAGYAEYKNLVSTRIF